MKNDGPRRNGNQDRRIGNRLAARGPGETLTFPLCQDITGFTSIKFGSRSCCQVRMEIQPDQLDDILRSGNQPFGCALPDRPSRM